MREFVSMYSCEGLDDQLVGAMKLVGLVKCRMFEKRSRHALDVRDCTVRDGDGVLKSIFKSLVFVKSSIKLQKC